MPVLQQIWSALAKFHFMLPVTEAMGLGAFGNYFYGLWAPLNLNGNMLQAQTLGQALPVIVRSPLFVGHNRYDDRIDPRTNRPHMQIRHPAVIVCLNTGSDLVQNIGRALPIK